MTSELEIKQQVREFYDQVGWQASDGLYQNASYEDLRPVVQEYIHKCHLRVLRHIQPAGRFLLDAGSGPIQYPEYLEYSRGYQRRVCADISLVALQEARKRIGSHGLYVVCDVAYLPFAANTFDGMVSLHTLHHLTPEDHIQSYCELQRTLIPGRSGVIVNGWDNPPISNFLDFWITAYHWLYAVLRPQSKPADRLPEPASPNQPVAARATYIRKHSASWLQHEVGSHIPLQIWCWRSVSVRFLRTFIHPRLGGRLKLKGIFWLEERFPHFLGKYGQYPLIVLSKPA